MFPLPDPTSPNSDFLPLLQPKTQRSLSQNLEALSGESHDPEKPEQKHHIGPREKAVVSDSLQSYGLQPIRLLCPWDSPGKNSGCLAMPSSRGSSQPQIKPTSLMYPALAGGFFTTSATWEIRQTSIQFSSVAQSCPTLCNPKDCSSPGLPVHHQLREFTQTHVR